jgi:Aspartyl protease
LTIRPPWRHARFILDTGAQRSLVTPAAVKRLDLALDEWVATTLRGVGGVERHRNALPRSIAIGGAALVRRTVSRDTSLTVGSLPGDEISGLRIDGLLGRDFLSLFDLSLDMPALTLTLYDVLDCTGAFLPWQTPYTALPVQNPAETALVVMLDLDGVRMRALLDTGASATFITAPGMARLKLSAETLSHEPRHALSGLGPRAVTMQARQFRRMRIGEESIEQPILWVAPVHTTPVADMLLGTDWLAGKLVWISFTTRQVFVAQRW